MFVSCLMPTFGRWPDYGHLVEEAVHSFLRQDRPNDSELLILSDCPEQHLVCELPGVRVINHPTRFASLGAKYNALVELARGDLLLPFEDDDLSLDGRIKQAVERIPDPTTTAMWKPPQVWFLVGEQLHWKHNVGVRHHASAFTFNAWEAVGGYPEISGAQDAGMDAKLMKYAAGVEDFPKGIGPEQWQYVYRWGVSPNHLSGNSDPEAAYAREGRRVVQPGTFEIRPHWRRDYQAMVRRAVEGLPR